MSENILPAAAQAMSSLEDDIQTFDTVQTTVADRRQSLIDGLGAKIADFIPKDDDAPDVMSVKLAAVKTYAGLLAEQEKSFRGRVSVKQHQRDSQDQKDQAAVVTELLLRMSSGNISASSVRQKDSSLTLADLEAAGQQVISKHADEIHDHELYTDPSMGMDTVIDS